MVTSNKNEVLFIKKKRGLGFVLATNRVQPEVGFRPKQAATGRGQLCVCVSLMLVMQISSVPIGKGAGPVSSASQLHPLQQDCCQLSVYGHTGQMRSSLSCSFLPKARPMASVQLKVTQDIRKKVRSAV